MNIFNSMSAQYLVTVYMKYTKMKLIAAFISLPSFSLHIKCPYTELFWSVFFRNFPAFGLNTER